jgi:membrane associated rhomboid family serine protease
MSSTGTGKKPEKLYRPGYRSGEVNKMLPIGDDNREVKEFPYVTGGLIALNVLFFIVELMQGDAFIETWAFVPSRFLADPAGQWLTIFTSMFMHAGWLHIGGNMLYLGIFGDNVENRFGHFRYLVFYLICGVAATFAQLAVDRSSVLNLGASGAIAGVLAAYLVLYPTKEVTVVLGWVVTRLPAIIVIGLWIVLQWFSEIGSILGAADTSGVAYMAHIGGFGAGLLLTLIFKGQGEA